MGISKISDPIQIKIKMPNPSQEPPASSKALNQDLKDMDVLCTLKIEIESWNLDHTCNKGQWPYPNQDQDVKPKSGTSIVLQSSNWGLKGHGFSFHLQNQNEAKILIIGVSKTNDHIQIKIKILNPSQKPQASNKSPNDDLKAMGVLCTFGVKIDSQNSDHGCVKDHWPYPNQDQGVKP